MEKEELNIEHNWRNKNKKIHGMEIDYSVNLSEPEEEAVSRNEEEYSVNPSETEEEAISRNEDKIKDDDTLPDVSQYKEFQALKKRRRNIKGGRTA